MIDDPDLDLDHQVSGKLYDPHVVGRLSRYLRPYVLPVGVGAALLIVLSGLEVLGPLILTRRSTDRWLRAGPTGLDCSQGFTWGRSRGCSAFATCSQS